jgi:hypothetical protein
MFRCHVLIKPAENYSFTTSELQFCNLSSQVLNIQCIVSDPTSLYQFQQCLLQIKGKGGRGSRRSNLFQSLMKLVLLSLIANNIFSCLIYIAPLVVNKNGS